MIVLLVLFFILILLSSKMTKDNCALALSKDQTQTIKGMFVVTIFFSHFCSYVILDKWFDVPTREYCRWLGQLMVVPFLFYSGYGIFESVKKKGESYIKSFPQKRILKTLIHFDLAVLLFIIYDFFFVPENLAVLKVLTSFVAWNSVGNSNWFIFAILCAYVFSFIAFVLSKGHLIRSLIIITVFCFMYIVVVSRFKEGYWFDTILAFPLGGFFSTHKEKFMILGRRWILWEALCIICLMVLLVAKNGYIPSSFINAQFAMVGFMLLIVFLSMKMKFKGKILSWLGEQVFGVYMLQRLPMNFGQYMHWNEKNIYLYFIFCFVVTLVLATLFHKATERIDSKIFKGPQ